MARKVVHTAFEEAHPLVGAVYVTITLALVMCALEPALVVLSCAGGFTYACVSQGPRTALSALKWQLPLVVVVALLNPFFSASGSTEVARIGVRTVYLESLCFGLTMAGLFVASVLWFQAAARMVPFDRAMTLLGAVAPVVTLMVCQAMRLIPRFVRQGRLIAQVTGVARPATVAGGVRAHLRLSTVLMGWTMEDSLETADAMRARGWGAVPHRTSYTRYRFTWADAVRLAAILAGGALVAIQTAALVGRYAFYPTMSALSPWWEYAAYAIWMFVPCALHVCEGRRFA